VVVTAVVEELKDPAQEKFLGLGRFSAGAIPSEVLRIATERKTNGTIVASSLLDDQVKSDPRHPIWCSIEQVARL
jgi:hypothetical protein